jgi:hypothetical protein
MAHYWITADDKKILISKLTDSHLLNIIAMLEKYAEEGLSISYGGGFDGDDMWYEEEDLYGQDVYDFFEKNGSYERLIAEKKKRKLFAKGESKWQKRN